MYWLFHAAIFRRPRKLWSIQIWRGCSAGGLLRTVHGGIMFTNLRRTVFCACYGVVDELDFHTGN